MNMIPITNPETGQKIGYFDPARNVMLADNGHGQLVTLMGGHAAQEQLVRMDVGVADVHVERILANFAVKYSNAEYKADLAAPPVPVDKESDRYFEFSPKDAFAPIDATIVAPGASYNKIGVTLTNSRYQTYPYALGANIPIEVLANQDSPLNLMFDHMELVLNKLLLNREQRVKTMLYTDANYTYTPTLLDLTVDPLLRWNGGSNSDPVANINRVREKMLAPATDMFMSLDTWNAMVENPAVQRFTGFKQAVPGLPTPDLRAAFAAFLNLPTIHVCEAKIWDMATDTYPYIWAGDVVLTHRPPNGNQVGRMTVTSAKTFRWNAGNDQALPSSWGQTQQPTVQGGFLVRQFYNPYEGPRGSMQVVVAHNDAEQFVSPFVTGRIKGAFQ